MASPAHVSRSLHRSNGACRQLRFSILGSTTTTSRTTRCWIHSEASGCQNIAPATASTPTTTEAVAQAQATDLAPAATPQKRPRDAWLRKGLKGLQVVHVISQDDIPPSSSPVSSATAAQVLCTYSWRNVHGAHILVPGTAPQWRDQALPVTLPVDRGLFFIDQNSAKARHPLEPLFRATASMKPDFCFNDVDIVSDRNSLRKLLSFCGCGDRNESFRLKLTLVRDSLLIERSEKSTREFATGVLSPGWGHGFERTFTTLPRHARDIIGHHRVLLYPLGHLRCAVRFEVDARYQGPETVRVAQEGTASRVVAPRVHSVRYSGGPRPSRADTQVTSTAPRLCTSMPQSSAAEMKTVSKLRGTGGYVQQLWFGRTPWLIVGLHAKGTFTEVRIDNLAAKFASWEERHQEKLQKLVTLLVQLREAVRRNGAQACIAIYEKRITPRAIRIFAAAEDVKAFPDDLIAKFWT